MSFLATNLQVLRKRLKLTQQHVADSNTLKRSTLSGYEYGTAEPNINTLRSFSVYFGISMDRLIVQDLRKVLEYHLGVLCRGYDKLSYSNQLDPFKVQ